MMKGSLTWGGEYTIQYTNDVLQSCTPKIHTFINKCYLNKFNKNWTKWKYLHIHYLIFVFPYKGDRDYSQKRRKKRKGKKRIGKERKGLYCLCLSLRIQSFLYIMTPITTIKQFTLLSLFVTLLFHGRTLTLNCHVL